jgi:hypothetical protein
MKGQVHKVPLSMIAARGIILGSRPVKKKPGYP